MKSNYRKLVYAILMFCLVMLLLSCSSRLEKRVKAFEAAINSHDVERVMSFYADDLGIEIAGNWQNMGRDEMRPMSEWDSAMNVRVAFAVQKVHGDTVFCKKTEQSDWFKLFGIDRVYFEPWTMVFSGEQIKEMTGRPTHQSAQDMQKALQAFMRWASGERAETLKELLPEGKFTYGQASAAKWLALLKEWRASGKAGK